MKRYTKLNPWSDGYTKHGFTHIDFKNCVGVTNPSIKEEECD